MFCQECALSDWWRVRLEVMVQGHYLQPERTASASSFSPSSLPASGLDWTKIRGVISEMHGKVYCWCRHPRACACVIMTLNGRRCEANLKTCFPVEHRNPCKYTQTCTHIPPGHCPRSKLNFNMMMKMLCTKYQKSSNVVSVWNFFLTDDDFNCFSTKLDWVFNPCHMICLYGDR